LCARSFYGLTDSTDLDGGRFLTIAAIGLNLTLGNPGRCPPPRGVCRHRRSTRSPDDEAGLPIPAAFVCAGALCFAIGWLIGYPALFQASLPGFRHCSRSELLFLVGLRNVNGIWQRITAITWHRAVDILLAGRPAARSISIFCLGMLAVLSAATWRHAGSHGGGHSWGFAGKSDRACRLLDTRRYTLMAFAIGLESRRQGRRLYALAGAVHRARLVRVGIHVFNLLLMVISAVQRIFLRSFVGAWSRCAVPDMDAVYGRILLHPLCCAGQAG
jgi:branched-chain amino acid transport system permease protein